MHISVYSRQFNLNFTFKFFMCAVRLHGWGIFHKSTCDRRRLNAKESSHFRMKNYELKFVFIYKAGIQLWNKGSV